MKYLRKENEIVDPSFVQYEQTSHNWNVAKDAVNERAEIKEQLDYLGWLRSCDELMERAKIPFPENTYKPFRVFIDNQRNTIRVFVWIIIAWHWCLYFLRG